MAKSFNNFLGNCIGLNGDSINRMKDDSVSITRKTFLKYVPYSIMKDMETSLGYDNNLRMASDWHVSYHKSTYKGRPCYYFCWSAIEYIFVK